jgi:hypothetical protein
MQPIAFGSWQPQRQPACEHDRNIPVAHGNNAWGFFFFFHPWIIPYYQALGELTIKFVMEGPFRSMNWRNIASKTQPPNLRDTSF